MAEPTATVSTTTGAVRGVAGDGVGRWRSIPYARPPVGELRLRAPQPAKPWRGVRHCHEFAWCAPQDPRFTRLGLSRHQPMSEDCLTLNVVAPEGPVDEPLPVMFFIHGGGYLFGSSATGIYDGSALARRGCVFVSANYRLGALGCIDLSSLATDEHPIDGNLAAIPAMSLSSARAPAGMRWRCCSGCRPPRDCFTARSRKARPPG